MITRFLEQELFLGSARGSIIASKSVHLGCLPQASGIGDIQSEEQTGILKIKRYFNSIVSDADEILARQMRREEQLFVCAEKEERENLSLRYNSSAKEEIVMRHEISSMNRELNEAYYHSEVKRQRILVNPIATLDIKSSNVPTAIPDTLSPDSSHVIGAKPVQSETVSSRGVGVVVRKEGCTLRSGADIDNSKELMR